MRLIGSCALAALFHVGSANAKGSVHAGFLALADAGKEHKIMVIAFEADGSSACIYEDALVPVLEAIGRVRVERASHVEPGNTGGWEADLSPVAPGVVLGPFRLRQEALDAEAAWIREHLL